MQNHTGWVEKPKNLPLPWRVNSTCSIMMSKSGQISSRFKHLNKSGLDVQICLRSAKHKTCFKSCQNGRTLQVRECQPFASLHLTESFSMGDFSSLPMGPTGTQKYFGRNGCDGCLKSLWNLIFAKDSVSGMSHLICQLGFPLFTTSFNNCVFRMWKVKLSSESDYLLFQAIADLLISAGGIILN